MKVNIDTTGFSYAQGVIDGVAGSVNANFLSTVVNYVHSDLNLRFETWMDALALARPENFMHVYEWGQLGMPGGHLWESVLRGRGAERTSTVIWKASKKAVPVRPELLIPGPTGKTVKEGVHVFYWKAPVMEAGINITVSPQSGGSGSLAYINSQGNLVITKRPSHFEAGGGKTRGQFTSAYYSYWTQVAQNTFDQTIAPKMEADLGLVAQKAMRRRRRVYGIKSDTASFKSGQNLGHKGLAAQKRNYEAAAAARRALIYGT